MAPKLKFTQEDLDTGRARVSLLSFITGSDPVVPTKKYFQHYGRKNTNSQTTKTHRRGGSADTSAYAGDSDTSEVAIVDEDTSDEERPLIVVKKVERKTKSKIPSTSKKRECKDCKTKDDGATACKTTKNGKTKDSGKSATKATNHSHKTKLRKQSTEVYTVESTDGEETDADSTAGNPSGSECTIGETSGEISETEDDTPAPATSSGEESETANDSVAAVMQKKGKKSNKGAKKDDNQSGGKKNGNSKDSKSGSPKDDQKSGKEAAKQQTTASDENWSVAEDALINFMKTHGATWADIAKQSARSKKEVQQRWKTLSATVDDTTLKNIGKTASNLEPGYDADAEPANSEGLIGGDSSPSKDRSSEKDKGKRKSGGNGHEKKVSKKKSYGDLDSEAKERPTCSTRSHKTSKKGSQKAGGNNSYSESGIEASSESSSTATCADLEDLAEHFGDLSLNNYAGPNHAGNNFVPNGFAPNNFDTDNYAGDNWVGNNSATENFATDNFPGDNYAGNNFAPNNFAAANDEQNSEYDQQVRFSHMPSTATRMLSGPDWIRENQHERQFDQLYVDPYQQMGPRVTPGVGFSEGDAAKLSAVAAHAKAEKWQRLQADYYNMTGRMVDVDVLKYKLREHKEKKGRKD